MNIGETIRVLRKEKNIKQFELADSSGVSQTYLSQIEKGVKTPTIDILKKICASLEVPFEVVAFLGLDSENLSADKKDVYNKFHPVISGLIKEIFL